MPLLRFDHGTPDQREHLWSSKSLTLGRAPSNDLVLEQESVSTYHARIEWRKDGFWVVDLNSTNGTRLNGEKIKEAKLRDGDALRIGKVVNCTFSVTAEELAEALAADKIADTVPPTSVGQSSPQMQGQPTPQTEAAPAALMRQGSYCQACGALIPFSVNFCPRCGHHVTSSNLPAMATQGMGYGGAMGDLFVRPMDAPGRGAGIFPLLAFLCGLSIIGFPFAIILGLVALSQIRKYGGFEADRKHAVWGVSLGFFWAAVFAAGGSWYGYVHYTRNQKDYLEKAIAKNEAKVLADLYGVARAEKFAKAIRFKDPAKSDIGQYVSLEELNAVGSSFFDRDIADGHAHGYSFAMRRADVSGFEIVAEPERYGATGKRTFSIDQTGIARAKDLEGKSFAQANEKIPDIENGKTAFDEVDDAIAAEVMAVAKRLASNGDYDRSRKLLDEVRDHFAVTKAAQELLALEKSIDPFIIEAQAQTRYQQAAKAAAEGDLKLAIGRLQEITNIYPSYTKIAAVLEELGKYQTALAQKVDKEAKALFDKAEALEREGKPEAAQDLYVQIEKNYSDTAWAQRIAQLKPALQKSIREKSAEQLYAQARDQSLSTDYQAIVNLIEQLQRNYADTDYVARNADAMASLNKKAQAQLYRAQAVERMNAGQDRDALAKLDEAATKNPDLRVALKDLFLKLYPRVAQRRLDESDEREALALYRKYLALEPEQNEVSPAAMARLNFAVAKAEFAAGNLKLAEQNLISARETYAQDAEFNDLYATVLASLGKQDDALVYYDRALLAAQKTKKPAANTLARRGYTQLLIALQIEKEAFAAFATVVPTLASTASQSATLDNSLPVTVPGATAAPAAFATALPTPAAGVTVEPRVKYDALASQQLRDEILNTLEQIRGSGAPSSSSTPTTTAPNPQPQQQPPSIQIPGINIQVPTTGGGVTSPQQNSTNAPPKSATQSAAKNNLEQLRSGLEAGNALSILHQKVLDDIARKKKAADALRLMAQRFEYGNRDLTDAIKLGATNAAELQEILKTTAQHQAKIAAAANKIAAFLEREIFVSKAGYDTVESAYRRSQMQTMSVPTDTARGLRVTFSKLFDRRDFDEGLQLLREAAEIKVPLDRYSLTPNSPAPDMNAQTPPIGSLQPSLMPNK